MGNTLVIKNDSQQWGGWAGGREESLKQRRASERVRGKEGELKRYGCPDAAMGWEEGSSRGRMCG